MSLHPAEEICGTTASPEGVAGGMPSSGDKGVCSSGESLTNRTMVVTSEYVKFWIPDVDDALLPTLGRRFPTLAQGIQFYMDYARASGFDVRHSTLKRGRDGAINMRYLVCSREGVKGGGRHKANYGQDGDGGSTKQRRRRISNRVKHMFLVFKDAQLDTIPPQYVVRRWRKQPSVEASIVGVSEGGTSNSGPNGLWIAINACAGMVGNSESRMSRMLQVLKELRQEFLIDGTSSSHGKGHSVAIQALCGAYVFGVQGRAVGYDPPAVRCASLEQKQPSVEASIVGYPK
nr:protein FAR1-RELATED SEQUENCE 5-like [Ipomoea batatas]